jgi:hypothetical protein
MAGIGRVERCQLLERLPVPDVDRPVQVSEAGEEDEPALRVEGDVVAREGAKVVDHVDAVVEDRRASGHVYASSGRACS